MSKKNRVPASADLKNDAFLKKNVIIAKMPVSVMEIVKNVNSKNEFAENENFYNENVKPEAEQVTKPEAEQVSTTELEKEIEVLKEVTETQVVENQAVENKQIVENQEIKETPEINFFVLLQELENRLNLVEQENKSLKEEQKPQISFEEMQERLLKINGLEENKRIFDEKKAFINEMNFNQKEDAFENDFFKLRLINSRDNIIFSISNNLILREFKNFTLDKINLKLQDIETEIKDLKSF